MANTQTLSTDKGVINPELLKLGVTIGFSPKTANRLNVFVTGRIGGGKSRFVTSKPRNLVLDFERASKNNPKPKSHVLEIDSHDKLLKTIETLVKVGQAASGFDSVTFDTADAWVEMEEAALAKQLDVAHIGEYGAKGAGWNRLSKVVRGRLRELEEAGFAWIVTGHLKETTIQINKQDVTVVRVALSSGVFGSIVKYADYMGMVEKEDTAEETFATKTINGKEVKIKTGVQTTSHRYLRIEALGIANEGKMRIPMPPRVEIDEYDCWDRFESEYTKAVATFKGEA